MPWLPACVLAASLVACSEGGGEGECTAETDAEFCGRLGKSCDPLSGDDNCGAPRTADCGTCAPPATCGGGGTPNVCGGPIDLGVLPEDRRTTWNPGLNSVGGIPARSELCASISAATYGDGAQDATAGIQAALDACPEGAVVQLSAGTFTIDADVLYLRKGVTLRGAGRRGAELTLLQRTNGATEGTYVPGVSMPIVVVGPNRWPSPGEAFDLAGDAVRGATTVQLAAAPAGGLAPGQIVLVDELSGADWRDDPAGRGRIWASQDFRVVWQRHDPEQGTDDPFPDALSWHGRTDRPIAELKEVLAWDGATRTVTFTSPFHIDYRTAHAAQLSVYDEANRHVAYAGVESLKLTGGDNSELRFECAAYSWAKDVEVTAFLDMGVAVMQSFRVEVRDSYLHHPVWMEPGGGSYNLGLSGGSSEILIENNVSVDADKVMVMNSAGAGSVVGYNYTDDGHIGSNPDWVEVGINGSHMAGSHHVLFEGNYSFNADSDKTHGNAIHHVFFRNHLSGQRLSYTDAGPRRCAGLGYYSYWHSFVGNVLGRPGQMDGWVYESQSMEDAAVWLLGWDDWEPYPGDPRVAELTFRHGNFDYLTDAVAWDADTAGRDLPASLYLTRKPAFFGDRPWPWVDPLGAEKLGALPAKERFEAGAP